MAIRCRRPSHQGVDLSLRPNPFARDLRIRAAGQQPAPGHCHLTRALQGTEERRGTPGFLGHIGTLVTTPGKSMDDVREEIKQL